MAAVGGCNQLGRDPETMARSADATFENICHAQDLTNAPDILTLPFECKRRGTGDYFKMRDLR